MRTQLNYRQLNYLQLSEPIVLAKYRHTHLIENFLINAVIKAFEAYQPPPLFHDIFGRAVPLNDDTLRDTRHPARLAEVRREWRDRIVSVIPEALEWSGLMCVHAGVERQEWWWREANFNRDWAMRVWDGEVLPGSGKIFMSRTFPKVVERRTPRQVNLFKLSRAQRGVFNITPAMVGGMEVPKWRVRICPVQAEREEKARAED